MVKRRETDSEEKEVACSGRNNSYTAIRTLIISMGYMCQA